ncbi:chymotrypsin inhibitor [Linepithema humile]|uniref:chymotrypsin inhibitor n=1 Tax=Linepithema humile TaxID=83485 RepID=UPI0006230623|nr:PREDICTED: chymotrypsin inhibitor-like [Linepithema humile]
MARAIILLLLIVAVSNISAVPTCGENEIYNTCGSSCPLTCQQPTPSVCTLACIRGCDCVEGFVRNAQSKCVLVQNC